MNCKPGDMALVVAGPKVNLGKTVTCMNLLHDGSHVVTSRGSGFLCTHGESIWRIDRKLSWTVIGFGPVESAVCADHLLLPIRPDEDDIPAERGRGLITGKIRVTAVDLATMERILLGESVEH